ncbi:toprim domain-containing protein [Peribacillus frigoritolerans]|nr:toprim domain-containing protein [Peribacillus frigoritolerans]
MTLLGDPLNKGGIAVSKQFFLCGVKLSIRKRQNWRIFFKNEEINTIIHAIGGGVGAEFNTPDTNYDKVIIMTDADTDGAHIQVLLLTFFYRYMKPLIESGKVYIALPPFI